MKKIYLLLIFFVLIAGCKENTSTPTINNPAGRTGKYSVEIKTYLYDFNSMSWEISPYSTEVYQYDASRPLSNYFNFSNLFGKNLYKGVYDERMGCPSVKNAFGLDYDRIEYTYDENKYISRIEYLDEGECNYRILYTMDNGKIKTMTCSDIPNSIDSTIHYFYEDASGYITRSEAYKNGIYTERRNYTHSPEGFLTSVQVINSTTGQDFITYTYNNLGLLTSALSQNWEITNQYNSLGLCTENKLVSPNESSTFTYTYDSFGFPLTVNCTGSDKDGTFKYKCEFKYSK